MNIKKVSLLNDMTHTGSVYIEEGFVQVSQSWNGDRGYSIEGYADKETISFDASNVACIYYNGFYSEYDKYIINGNYLSMDTYRSAIKALEDESFAQTFFQELMKKRRQKEIREIEEERGYSLSQRLEF